MMLIKKSITTQKWVARQATLQLRGGKWRVSFLATSQGSITEIGGMVAEFSTPVVEQATEAMTHWITSGIVPSSTETHAPDWFETWG